MVMQSTECEEISGRAQPGDLSKRDPCNIRSMAEFFALMDIGQMYLNCR